MSSSGADAPLVLVVGDVIDDIIVQASAPTAYATDTPAEITRVPGGSGANLAAWLAYAGARVRFAGRVGEQDVGRHGRALAAAGVEAHLAGDPRASTGTIVVLVDADGERTMYTDRAANRRLGRSDLPDALLDRADAVHVSGYSFFEPGSRGAVRELIARARGRGLRVSVDPGSAGFIAAVGPSAFLTWMEGVDVLFPNLAEGQVLTGVESHDEVVGQLLERVPLVVLTCGPDGVVVGLRDRDAVALPAVEMDVVDTTGAGDAFCGAFLRSWLRDGDPLAAARRGLVAGARASAVPGARPSPPRAAPG